MFWKVFVKTLSAAVSMAILVLIGIVAAAIVKETNFTTEWSNMIAWISGWAN